MFLVWVFFSYGFLVSRAHCAIALFSTSELRNEQENTTSLAKVESTFEHKTHTRAKWSFNEEITIERDCWADLSVCDVCSVLYIILKQFHRHSVILPPSSYVSFFGIGHFLSISPREFFFSLLTVSQMLNGNVNSMEMILLWSFFSYCSSSFLGRQLTNSSRNEYGCVQLSEGMCLCVCIWKNGNNWNGVGHVEWMRWTNNSNDNGNNFPAKETAFPPSLSIEQDIM